MTASLTFGSACDLKPNAITNNEKLRVQTIDPSCTYGVIAPASWYGQGQSGELTLQLTQGRAFPWLWRESWPFANIAVFVLSQAFTRNEGRSGVSECARGDCPLSSSSWSSIKDGGIDYKAKPIRVLLELVTEAAVAPRAFRLCRQCRVEAVAGRGTHARSRPGRIPRSLPGARVVQWWIWWCSDVKCFIEKNI